MVETHYHIPGAPWLALLTDSHNCPPAPILSSLRSRSPGIILIAGDFVYGSTPTTPGTLKMEESTAALELIRGCVEVAPTFISLGNHEWMLHASDLQLIRSTGAVVLDNTFISTVVDGEQMVIGGLRSARVTAYQRWRDAHPSSELYPRETYYVERAEPDTAWISEMERAEGYRILLCHHPEYYHLLRSHSIDLILSGHAHGGQWRVFNHGVWSPGQGLWPALTSGVVDGRLIISRGLANTTVIPLINNRPEIVYIS